MEPAEHLSHLRDEIARFGSVVRADPDAAVPACPGWSRRDLAQHVGNLHRWVGRLVRAGGPERVPFPDDPIDPDDPARWYEACGAEMLAALEACDPDGNVWTFRTGGFTNRFWFRRQAVELAVHLHDAESATGEPGPIDPELAADGVDEFLHVMIPLNRRGSQREGAGETYHFHRTDGDGEWTVRFDDGGMGATVERAHGKGAVAARGRAEDLLLFLWHRLPADRLEVFGDAPLLDRWFELVPPA